MKNFARHTPNELPDDMPSKWGKRSDDPERVGIADRGMGAVGEGTKGAILGSQVGGAPGAVVGGVLGTLKGFFGTSKGKGSESLVGGAEALARSKFAKGKTGAKGKGKGKRLKDDFLEEDEVLVKSGPRVHPDDEWK
jgi:hypothetical protein